MHGREWTRARRCFTAVPATSSRTHTHTHTHTQIKAYTKAHGIPESWNSEDRGYVAIRHDYWITEEFIQVSNTTYHTLSGFYFYVALFIFLNILVVMLSVQFAPHWYNKLKQMAIFSDQLMPIYWATIIVLVLFNTLFLIASLTGTVDIPQLEHT